MTIKRLIFGLVSITMAAVAPWLLGLWLVPPAYNVRSWRRKSYL